MVLMPTARPYGGVDAAERVSHRRRRFLHAGLDLLGSDAQVSELTVRGICRRAGLGARYFYESFTDKDDLVATVYEWVVADLAATTQAAVNSAPPDEQSRAAMANIVRTISADPRLGRLLFGAELSHPVVMRKRSESTTLFVMLLFQHAGSMGLHADAAIRAASHFAVGGVGQTLSAWLAGDVDLTEPQLVDQLAAHLNALAQP